MSVDHVEFAWDNMQALAQNEYPGRGLILGQSDLDQDIAVYWLMGRSESSRNRKLVLNEADGSVRTEAYDPSKIDRPDLLIYTAIRETVLNEERCQIVSNGDQTDTIFEFMQNGDTFVEALRTRTFEPDAPNYTPRISGLLIPTSGFSWPDITLSKIFRSYGYGNLIGEDHSFFPELEDKAGFGKMLHTYERNGDPLPSFDGGPRLVLLEGNAEVIGQKYWSLLNARNRVALVVKAVDRSTSNVDWALFNQFGGRVTQYFSLAV